MPNIIYSEVYSEGKSLVLDGEIPVESPWNPPGLPAIPVARPPGRRDLARPAAEPPAGHGNAFATQGERPEIGGFSEKNLGYNGYRLEMRYDW